jgi:arylsulfatase A-like enzyme
MQLLRSILTIIWGLTVCHPVWSEERFKEPDLQRPPNVVIFLIDDLGYADIGPFGCRRYSTPNLDRMARQGRKFTDFVASTAVCSASRASLMTGCLSPRVGISGALGPNAKMGIHSNEVTLGELCKQKGYATACFGKWHLGHEPEFLPLQHGFDEFLGIPYSNDMWPFHPDYVHLPPDAANRKRGFPDLPLIQGNKVKLASVTGKDQAEFTTLFTESAVSFIQSNSERPFFLYVAHPMVHVPLFVSDKFKDQSGVGLFADVVMEVDWSVGQVLDTLEKLGLNDETLVIFTSDNGPWLSYGGHAGSAGPLREGKGTMWEGGYRVPTMMQWTGKIPPNSSCDEFASSIDLFPTIAKLIDAQLPNHAIDGTDISQLMLLEPPPPSPHEHFACYYDNALIAVRDRQYKLVFPHAYRSIGNQQIRADGRPIAYRQTQAKSALYDLKADIGETADVAAKFPQVVSRLSKAAAQYRLELGDVLTQSKGKAIRPAGRLE